MGFNSASGFTTAQQVTISGGLAVNPPVTEVKIASRTGSATVTDQVVYTVPASKKFIVLGFKFNTLLFIATSCAVKFVQAGGSTFFYNSIGTATYYPMQLVLNTGETIKYDYNTNDGSGNMNASIIGYETNI